MEKEQRDELRRRIEALYEARSLADEYYETAGALTWFAKKIGSHPKNVINWVNGLRSPSIGGPLEFALEQLEKETRRRLQRREAQRRRRKESAT